MLLTRTKTVGQWKKWLLFRHVTWIDRHRTRMLLHQTRILRGQWE